MNWNIIAFWSAKSSHIEQILSSGGAAGLGPTDQQMQPVSKISHTNAAYMYPPPGQQYPPPSTFMYPPTDNTPPPAYSPAYNYGVPYSSGRAAGPDVGQNPYPPGGPAPYMYSPAGQFGKF